MAVARRWYGRDTGLSVRMFLTMFLLAVVYLAFLTFLFWIGVDSLFLVVIAGGFVLAQYFFSDKLVLMTMGAKVVDEREAPELHALVERLSSIADLPKPKVAVVQTEVPNAFATGRSPKNAVVAVTTGLLSRLNEREVEGVLAHELSHVKN